MSLARSFTILAFTSASAFAQPGQPVPPPGPPVPAEAPPGPPVAPAIVAQDGVPIGERLIVEPIEEPKLSGISLAGLYRLYTGRRVITSAAAAAAEFSFVQDASPEDPLTFAEAAELLKKAATIENFIFVPDATDPNLEFLTLATGGIRPIARGVPVYNENDQLPEGDAVISYVMRLDFIKPDEAVRTFTQIIGQLGAFGSIAAVPNAAAVVITENTSLIRKLVDLKDEIDKPSSQVATRFIKVQFADVIELAAVLNELLNTQQSAQRSAGVQRAGALTPAPAPGGGDAPSLPGVTPEGGSSSGEETPVQIVPEPRTNRIVAMGRPVDILFVEGLIREFDTETDQKNFLRRRLSHIAVVDFLDVAETALTRAFAGTGDSGAASAPAAQGGGRGQGGRIQGGQNQPTTQQQRGGGFGAGGANPAFGGGGAGAGGAATRTGGLSDPQVSSAPEARLVGRTLLVADNITNSIIAQGPPSGLEIIEKLLDEIDVRPDQVMISTVFGQLALTDTNSTGVNWLRAFRGSERGGLAGSILSGGPSVVQPDSLLDLDLGANGFPSTTGLSLYGRIGRSLGAYVNLLQSNNDFTILSRPSIFTSNNQRGTISSGRRIAIPTNSNQFSGGGVSTNIEYREVVLRLEVIPLVNSPDEITLDISLLNDEVIGQSANIQGIGSVPIIGTREIVTKVTVPNNETVVLGGLITTSDTENVTGIPILSSIPGLGRLFSTKEVTQDRNELMIFIQPSIVSGSRTLDDVQVDMDARYKLSPKVHEFADGPGVLPPPDHIYPLDDKAGTVVERRVERRTTVKPASAPVVPAADPRTSSFRRFR